MIANDVIVVEDTYLENRIISADAQICDCHDTDKLQEKAQLFNITSPKTGSFKQSIK